MENNYDDKLIHYFGKELIKASNKRGKELSIIAQRGLRWSLDVRGFNNSNDGHPVEVKILGKNWVDLLMIWKIIVGICSILLVLLVLLFLIKQYKLSKEMKSLLENEKVVSENILEKSDQSFRGEVKYVIWIIILCVMTLLIYNIFIVN